MGQLKPLPAYGRGMTHFTISEIEGPALSYSRHLLELKVELEEPVPHITNAYVLKRTEGEGRFPGSLTYIRNYSLTPPGRVMTSWCSGMSRRSPSDFGWPPMRGGTMTKVISTRAPKLKYAVVKTHCGKL